MQHFVAAQRNLKVRNKNTKVEVYRQLHFLDERGKRTAEIPEQEIAATLSPKREDWQIARSILLGKVTGSEHLRPNKDQLSIETESKIVETLELLKRCPDALSYLVEAFKIPVEHNEPLESHFFQQVCDSLEKQPNFEHALKTLEDLLRFCQQNPSEVSHYYEAQLRQLQTKLNTARANRNFYSMSSVCLIS